MSEINDEIKGWLMKASDDYEAYLFLTLAPEHLAGNTAFHAQQAVEKYVKGLLIFKGFAPPRTHDIVLLIGLLRDLYPELNTNQWLKRSQSLNQYAIDIRYPEARKPVIRVMPDMAAIDEALHAFKAFVEEKLGS